MGDEGGKLVPGAMHGRTTGHIYVDERDDRSLVRLSEAVVRQENMRSLRV